MNGNKYLFEVYTYIKQNYPSAIPLIKHNKGHISFGADALLIAAKCNISANESKNGIECIVPKSKLLNVRGILIKCGYRVAIADNI